MPKRQTRKPPRWFLSIVLVGALLASGLYIGMMRTEGPSTSDLIRAIGYGVLGLLMLWGVLGGR